MVGIDVSFWMFTAGLLLRRNPASHKRLMLFGTVGMNGLAIARWPFEFIASRPSLVGLVMQSFALAMIIFDLLTRRRILRATWVGTATLFAVPLFAVPLSATPLWHHLLASLKLLLTRF